MNSQNKFAISVAAGILAFLILVYVGGGILGSVSDQPAGMDQDLSSSEQVAGQMWGQRSFDMLILGIMIFSGVLGILALVGGEFKWQ